MEVEYEKRNTSNVLIAIAELVETRKLSSWMSKQITTSSTRRCGPIETSTTAQRELCGSCPDHFPEVSLSTLQLFNCDILISSCCATKMTKLDEKFTDDEMRETILRDRHCLNVDELVVLVNSLSVFFLLVSVHCMFECSFQSRRLSIRLRSYGATGLACCFRN